MRSLSPGSVARLCAPCAVENTIRMPAPSGGEASTTAPKVPPGLTIMPDKPARRHQGLRKTRIVLTTDPSRQPDQPPESGPP